MHDTEADAVLLDSELLTLTDLSLDELDDSELLAFARRDHPDAYAALFKRHAYAAQRLARHLGQREEADDIVSESFAQVLDLVRRGKGPDRAFRAYLFTTIRHEAGRRGKARQRVMPTDDHRHIDSPVPFGGGDLDDFEKSAVRGAYESLPERWRTVLWHLEVEGRKPQELGPLLEMSPNSVSALVYRARSALREAYLQQHVNHERAVAPVCRKVRTKLSAYVRLKASAGERSSIGAHLESCPECAAVYADLREVNREVGTIAGTLSVAMAVIGLLGAGASAAWSSLTGYVVAAGKTALAVLAPPATVAVFTAATVMGVTASEAQEPQRYPMTVQDEAPQADRARVASPPTRSAPRPPSKQRKAGTGPVESADPAPEAAEPGASEPQPAPSPEVPSDAGSGGGKVDQGDAVAVEVGDDGLRARIARVTIEISSRTVASVLSLGTTN